MSLTLQNYLVKSYTMCVIVLCQRHYWSKCYVLHVIFSIIKQQKCVQLQKCMCVNSHTNILNRALANFCVAQECSYVLEIIYTTFGQRWNYMIFEQQEKSPTLIFSVLCLAYKLPNCQRCFSSVGDPNHYTFDSDVGSPQCPTWRLIVICGLHICHWIS